MVDGLVVMRIDLHTHSSVSDGTDDPTTLVRNAAAAGLDVVALTDHDTYDGWDAAHSVAAEAGVTVVGGMEMSTSLDGFGVHVLAYLPDPGYGPLAAELGRIRDDRSSRVRRVVERLRGLGVDVGVEDVHAVAPDASALGRPHVADALVAKGHVADRGEAFGRWLSEGGPAYVHKYAPETQDAVALIRAAGGAAVLAHPWGRSSRGVLTPEVIAELADAGLAGIEADHDDHGPDERIRLRDLAGELGLVVTGSSDYHGSGKTGHDLGRYTTDQAEYERLLDRAADAATQAGRTNPPREVGSA